MSSKKSIVAIALSVVGIVVTSSIALAMNLGVLAATNDTSDGVDGGLVDPELVIESPTTEAETSSQTVPVVDPPVGDDDDRYQADNYDAVSEQQVVSTAGAAGSGPVSYDDDHRSYEDDHDEYEDEYEYEYEYEDDD